MISDKKILRQKYRNIRSASKSCSKDRCIFESLTALSVFRCADTVYLYYSSGSEVDTTALIDFCLESGKKVALPKCIDESGNMEFYLISDRKTSVTQGMYGISEPDISKCCKAADDEKTLCIVPALAFDLQGYRLGYGRGYYDRFLSKFKGKSIGLCYEECLCDKLPFAIYDRKVEMLITERKIYFYNEEEYIYGR